MMKTALLAFSALTLAVAATTLLAQPKPARTVYPANAEHVSYAEIDQLPDWRGIWQPNIGKIGGDQPVLLGKYKKHYEEERAKVAANPHYEIPEKTNNCERDNDFHN